MEIIRLIILEMWNSMTSPNLVSKIIDLKVNN